MADLSLTFTRVTTQDIILNGTVGGLYQMNCIESLLWGVQNKYHPQEVSATEFGAYILVDMQKTTVKVYLQTGPTLGVPGMDWVTTPIKVLMSFDLSFLAKPVTQMSYQILSGDVMMFKHVRGRRLFLTIHQPEGCS